MSAFKFLLGIGLTAFASVFVMQVADAQTPESPGGAEQAQTPPPVVGALDVDGDGTISAEEIKNAYASLKKLDRNGDGLITRDEFRPQGAPSGPQGGQGQGGPAMRGPGQGQGQGGPGMRGPGQGQGQGGPGMRGPGQGQGQGGPGMRGPGQGQGQGGPGMRGPGQGQGQGGPGMRGPGQGQGQGGPGMRGPGQGKGQGGPRMRGPGQGQGQGSSASLGSTHPSEVNPRDLPDRPRDIRFRNSIGVGQALPVELEIHDTSRKRIPMRQLFGDRYTVVVAGCLTCPAFLNAYREIEAVYADYQDKVDFYFLYHSLAHPENRGFVQPISIDERFLHIAEAKKSLGTKVPWIADTMENELKELYVFASNPEFIFAPSGEVVHREPWSRGTSIRGQLEKLVGPSSQVTSVESLGLPDIEKVSEGDRSGVVERVQVSGIAVPLRFEAAPSNQTWYAKLRPEVDQQLLQTGSGQMYLGFHLDPVQHVQWNNLAPALKYELTGPAGVQLSPASGEGVRPDVQTDGDPREFLVSVNGWEPSTQLSLKVSYVACSKSNNSCIPVTQQYRIFLANDPTAGRVNGRTHKAGGAPRQGPRGHGQAANNTARGKGK